MRVDKFLKVSRLVKRRETAKDLCEAGNIKVNDRPAKPSLEINEGDSLFLKIGRHRIKAIVKEIRPFANKEEASRMYEITEETIDENKFDQI